jgi:hypothetical protein
MHIGAATALANGPSDDKSYDHVIKAGNIANQAIDELSGLACSRLSDTMLWAINDGGSQPLLFAVGSNGADLGSVSITGARNRDWEDIAAFKLDSTAYLLIADVGDNSGSRKSCTIYIIEEPTITGVGVKETTTAKIAARIRYTYEDGPRDCEAVAVDPVQKKILLLSKRTSPAVLYELPLEPSQKDSTEIARRKTDVSDIVIPSAMDISPQGNSAAVLTYNQAYLFVRYAGENWSTVFSRTPKVVSFPVLLQQEAICFSKDGKSLYISSEGRYAPLLRIDLEAVPASQ